jgi:electron transfer flavoprotein alpha subunit
MAQNLVVAEFSEGKLRRTTHSAVTFARRLGGGYVVLLSGGGAGVAAAAEELSKLGAAGVLVAEDASLERYSAERYAPIVATVAKERGVGVVCAAASAFGKDLLPRVAARLGAGYAADVTDVSVADGAPTYKRPMFAGNAFGVCRVTTPVAVVSVRQSAFVAAEPTGETAPIAKVAVTPPGAGAERVSWVKFDQVKSERPELTEARVVISGGRALKERFYEVMNPLADVLGAAVGASRAACDAGYCAPDLQVGQTGKVVAPSLYFAIGISGAIQHLAGMKSSKVIVAINKDGEAPIFQVADYGLVADLFQVVPELVDKIGKMRAEG